MSINVSSAILKKRIKNRKLPNLNTPKTGVEEVDRALLQIREYLQMYEGDTNSPKERFVTLDELENAGLIGTATRQGFSSINKVLGTQVDPVKSSNPTRKQILEITKTGAERLSELADSEVDGASPNDFFVFDGSNWTNRALFSANNVWSGINRFNSGYIEFQERQASDGPVAQAGRGYLWLEDGQTLYFRDEAGSDTDLTAAGGGLTDVVDDLTPQLGGNLDSNGSDIVMLDSDKVFFGTGSDASMYFDGTSMLIDGVNDVSNLLIQNFASMRFYDVLGTDYMYFEHDGTDAYIGGVNTAGLELQFFTALTASLLQTTTLGTHVYDSDQTVGAGQDDYVMTYDHSLGTIQLEAAAGGGGGRINTDINTATPPTSEAVTGNFEIYDLADDDELATFGYNASNVLEFRNKMTSGDMEFYVDDNLGTQTRIMRLHKGNSANPGEEGYAMFNRVICNYLGSQAFSPDDPPFMVTNSGGDEDGQTQSNLSMWYNSIQAYTASAAAGSTLSINPSGGTVNIGNTSGAGTTSNVLLANGTLWIAQTKTAGLNLSWRTSTAPSGGAVPNDAYYSITTHAQSHVASFGARASDNSMVLTHDIHGAPWIIEGQNEVGNPRKIATFDTTQATSGVYIGETNQQSSLWLLEETAAMTSQATWGQIWVKDDIPNTLWFTDDAGTDHQLGVGGSGDVTASGTPVDGQLAVWTSATDIEGDANLSWSGTILELQSVGGNILKLKDNNTSGAGAAVSMIFTDSADTTQATIGTLPIVNTLSLSATGSILLAAGAGNGIQFDSDTSFTLTGGGTFSINDSTDTDSIAIDHDGTDVNVVCTNTTEINWDTDFNMADNKVITPELDDYSVTSAALTVSANAVTVTYGTAQAPVVDLEAATGAVTITVSGGPPSGTYGEMIIRVQQDSTADRTLTWAGGTFVWPGGTVVAPKTGSDAITIYYLSTWDTGTTWYINGVEYG